MPKKILLFLLLISIYTPLKAQLQLSVYSEVSIITAGPGEELYEAFGHAAIRIKDPMLQLDIIYNYGVFDFNQPNFYTNFAKGNMMYSLARYDFNYFLESYANDKRWVKQQVLQLTQQQKQDYFIFLENNALPENRNYRYDPYFNNCATILRDITTTILGNKMSFNDANLGEKLTFRQLTNNEIHWNTWGSFGLNLIAGIKLDEKATLEQYLFLPDYVYSSFKNATVFIENQPKELVKREDDLLNFDEKQPVISFFNPLLIFSILCLLGIYITYTDYKHNKRSNYLDFILFFTTGLIGSILFFLWFFSTHSTAPNNYNILWAFPLNILVGFILIRKNIKKWVVIYVQFIIVALVAIPILWFSNIQQFPLALIPLLLLFLVRFLFLSKRLLPFKI